MITRSCTIHLQNANDLYRRALSLRPMYIEAAIGFAKRARSRSERKEALLYLRRISNILQGRYESEAHVLSIDLSVVRDANCTAPISLFYTILGEMELKQKGHRRAVMAFRQAVVEDPSNEVARRLLQSNAGKETESDAMERPATMPQSNDGLPDVSTTLEDAVKSPVFEKPELDGSREEQQQEPQPGKPGARISSNHVMQHKPSRDMLEQNQSQRKSAEEEKDPYRGTKSSQFTKKAQAHTKEPAQRRVQEIVREADNRQKGLGVKGRAETTSHVQRDVVLENKAGHSGSARPESGINGKEKMDTVESGKKKASDGKRSAESPDEAMQTKQRDQRRKIEETNMYKQANGLSDSATKDGSRGAGPDSKVEKRRQKVGSRQGTSEENSRKSSLQPTRFSAALHAVGSKMDRWVSKYRQSIQKTSSLVLSYSSAPLLEEGELFSALACLLSSAEDCLRSDHLPKTVVIPPSLGLPSPSAVKGLALPRLLFDTTSSLALFEGWVIAVARLAGHSLEGKILEMASCLDSFMT